MLLVPLWLNIFRVCFINLVWAYMCCLCDCHILCEHLRCILEFCHMIYSGPGIILVSAFSYPSYDTIFLLFFLWGHMGQWFWWIHCYFSNIIVGIFHFKDLNAGFWLAEILFYWFSGLSPNWYASTIGTLRESTLVIWFDCSVPFI